ncbi:hypothetical protein FDP41_007249 [Naegleria fowleri]|uniref:Uncharacterized protein n=1 Tax=Naegleria fowleri TaxID=5763 RepID=A0A6A5BGE6_NAEFO|nr:uncharacterized protein FDP41_007249 [Naegleria fowleri]KAF0973862.1 hypothetical protein FDP41_007249 [Naegleria fowleri]
MLEMQTSTFMYSQVSIQHSVIPNDVFDLKLLDNSLNKQTLDTSTYADNMTQCGIYMHERKHTQQQDWCSLRFENLDSDFKKRKYDNNNQDATNEFQITKKKKNEPYSMKSVGNTSSPPQSNTIYLEWMKRRSNTEQVYEYFIHNREHDFINSDNSMTLDE